MPKRPGQHVTEYSKTANELADVVRAAYNEAMYEELKRLGIKNANQLMFKTGLPHVMGRRIWLNDAPPNLHVAAYIALKLPDFKLQHIFNRIFQALFSEVEKRREQPDD